MADTQGNGSFSAFVFIFSSYERQKYEEFSYLRHRDARPAVFALKKPRRANTRTCEQEVFAHVRMFAENRAQNRTESGPKLPAP